MKMPRIVYVVPLSSLEEDEHWLNWYAGYGFTAETHTFDETLAAFAEDIKGAVIYDENLRVTIPIALSIAGARDYLVVRPDEFLIACRKAQP